MSADLRHAARHFEALYAASEDPWDVRGSWYEQRKRALLLACLHQPRYRHVFEPGCGNGAMSAHLAARCDRLLAVDGAPSAVAAARRTLAGATHCTVEQACLPRDWPPGPFDLIVISELAYYFDAAGLATLSASAHASLADEGLLLLCHWRHDFDDRQSSTEAVHATFGAAPGLVAALRHVERDFVLEGWRKQAAGAGGPA